MNKKKTRKVYPTLEERCAAYGGGNPAWLDHALMQTTKRRRKKK